MVQSERQKNKHLTFVAGYCKNFLRIIVIAMHLDSSLRLCYATYVFS